MHKKENNKFRNFTQGLKPFSSLIPKTLKKYLKKGGYNYSNIIDNWTKIVDRKISNFCYPISIKMGKEMRKGTLVLNVIHGKELDIEYAKKDIIDKINLFFGYECISKVTLKIADEKLKLDQKKIVEIKDISKINEKMNKIQNNQLKSSLNSFIKAFNEKNN
tara:strand:+ start:694 stop:1179 length:486 start_codon:yes stop_codon:yes gene_type:complete